jgi:hypothetical protein
MIDHIYGYLGLISRRPNNYIGEILMGKALDLTGQRFGRLVALRKTEKRNSQGLVIWEFQCDCGNIVEKTGASVKRGITQSCGCLRRETTIQKNIDNGRKINIGDRFGSFVVIEDLGFRL